MYGACSLTFACYTPLDKLIKRMWPMMWPRDFADHVASRSVQACVTTLPGFRHLDVLISLSALLRVYSHTHTDLVVYTLYVFIR